MQPDAKFKNVLECTTTCGLRYMYLQYVVKKKQCEAVPDRARQDQGHQLASPHRIVQDHLFLMQPECGKKPRGYSDEKQDSSIWDVVLIEGEP